MVMVEANNTKLTKTHIKKIATINSSVTFLMNKNGYCKSFNDSTPFIIEDWYDHNFEYSIRNIVKLEILFNEKILDIMEINKEKNSLLDQILADIPPHTQRLMNIEMMVIGRIHDLLEMDGWTKDKVNKKTPDIIKQWYNEQFDFSLLSIAKMEDALNGVILKVISYE